MNLHAVSHEAMATEFQIVIAHDDEAYAASAGRAVIDDINLLEGDLSRFRTTSEIGRLNTLGAGEKIELGYAAFDCLSLARDLFRETSGAFDASIGPLYKLWRSPIGTLTDPSDEEVDAARAKTGMDKLTLDPDTLTATPEIDGLQFDLGGIGKGYALDQAAAMLADWEIPNFLLNAGDSTVYAAGSPPGEDNWQIALGAGDPTVLNGSAVSGSGYLEKGHHIIDPRTGRPVTDESRTLVWAAAPTASVADALSTAFLVMDRDEINAFCERHQDGIEAIFLDQAGER